MIDNPSGHTARGLNLGLAAARGKYWVRVDGHSEVPPGGGSGCSDGVMGLPFRSGHVLGL